MWLAAAVLCFAPHGAAILEEAVDVIEVNHFFDDQGRKIFDQVIFYDWSPRDERYQVVAWRLMKGPNQFPVRSGERYVTAWFDGERLRKIWATSFRETFTRHDPELMERNYLVQERRPLLMGEKGNSRAWQTREARGPR